jgi:hypothetical protein
MQGGHPRRTGYSAWSYFRPSFLGGSPWRDSVSTCGKPREVNIFFACKTSEIS